MVMNKNMNIVVQVHGEMVKNKGEDSYSEYIQDDRGYIGIYDGCGGIGSKRYRKAGGNTGAYLASRLTALSVYRWVKSHIGDIDYFMGNDVHHELQNYIRESLNHCKEILDDDVGIRLKGGLSRTFPTTAALFFYNCRENDIYLKFMWAGDSRGYIFDKYGLAQVTKDDIDENQDAFSNLTNDSKLENVINADKDFVINERSIVIKKPCMVLVSSDGVFGYIPTPMEFEYMLLATLERSESFHEWQNRISKFVSEYASDDYTLTIGLFGFESFDDVKAYYNVRKKYMYTAYIKKISAGRKREASVNLKQYWNIYSETYERYLR